jgi:hypothetical protein
MVRWRVGDLLKERKLIAYWLVQESGFTHNYGLPGCEVSRPGQTDRRADVERVVPGSPCDARRFVGSHGGQASREAGKGMSWKPPFEKDAGVRQWMKSRGFEVHRTHYDSKRDVYGWRQEGAERHTLHIARFVIAYYTEAELVALLDRLKVAEAMRAHPKDYVLVRHKGDSADLEILPGPPH